MHPTVPVPAQIRDKVPRSAERRGGAQGEAHARVAALVEIPVSVVVATRSSLAAARAAKVADLATPAGAPGAEAPKTV